MKNFVKKALSVIVSMTMVFTLLLGTNVHGIIVGSLSVGISSDKTELGANSDVTITVNGSLYDVITDGIVGISVKISYDSSKFSYKAGSATVLQGLAGDGSIDVNDIPGTTEGVLNVIYHDNFVGSTAHPLIAGDFFSVKFTSKEDFSGTAAFAVAGLNDADNFVDNSVNPANSYVAANYSPAISVTMSSVTLGDINGDGNVKIADAMMVFQHVSGKITLTASQMEAADINGDGLIKIADAMRIFQFVSGKNPTL